MHGGLGSAFQLLDKTLGDNQDLWLSQPFTCSDLPWSRTHGHLKDALIALNDKELVQLHNCPQQRLRWFQQREPELCAALYAFEPESTEPVRPLEVSSFDSLHIPGRKWQQVLAFAGALPHRELPHVDWCAGKGHLSRIVQRNQRQPVHCMEWDASLVAVGEALAKQQGRDIHYHHHNVLQPLPAACTDAAQVHIGLHACGELHQQLLQQVVSCGAAAVALSPCCYHKTSADQYLPLSGAARKSRLRLNRPALHLAVQEAVTARRGERLLREQERLWRLGFDALQRELRGSDEYLSVPSCKRELLRQGFPAFCQWAARAKQITLPEGIAYDHYLQLGGVRHRDIVRLELLRQLFTRPLELWLVLDCALYLEEHGYRVTVTQFCERGVSPRNLLIQGDRDQQ
ncbi:MAG: methyltransferase [Halioglobus sp.]|nr:methyltransferase [Halioglobus sp.]